jgi:hypothetical protein
MREKIELALLGLGAYWLGLVAVGFGFSLMVRDELVLTIIVFGVLLTEIRDVRHKSRYLSLVAVFLSLHMICLFLLFHRSPNVLARLGFLRLGIIAFAEVIVMLWVLVTLDQSVA